MVPKHRAICEPNKAGKASSWEDPCHRPTEASTRPRQAPRRTWSCLQRHSKALGWGQWLPWSQKCLLSPGASMPVLPLAPASHLLFDGTSDHLPYSRICVLACLPGLGTVLLVAPAPFSPVSARTLITCLIPQPYSRVLGLSLPWPHEPGSHPRI